MTDLLNRLSGVRKLATGWTARCPAHDDKHNSLSVHHRDGKWLVRCHVGCGSEDIVAAIGQTVSDLFDHNTRGTGGADPSSKTATLQRSAPSGLTLEQYAAA